MSGANRPYGLLPGVKFRLPENCENEGVLVLCVNWPGPNMLFIGTNSAAPGFGVFLAESKASDERALVISLGEMLFEDENIFDLSNVDGEIVRADAVMYVLSLDSAGRVDVGEKAWKTGSTAGLVVPSGVRTMSDSCESRIPRSVFKQGVVDGPCRN